MPSKKFTTKIDELDSLKKEVHLAFICTVMQHNAKLAEQSKEDVYPSDKYLQLSDVVKKKVPRKKPVASTREDDEKDDKKEEDAKKKSHQIAFNKDARFITSFIVDRFIREIKSIDDYDEKCPATGDKDVSDFMLNSVVGVHSTNITELIINSVNKFDADAVLPESYELDYRFRTAYDAIIKNGHLSNVAAKYMTRFIKILAIYISTELWSDKLRTLNKNKYETILQLIAFAATGKYIKDLLDDVDTYIKREEKKTSKKNTRKNASDEEKLDKEKLDKDKSKKKNKKKNKKGESNNEDPESNNEDPESYDESPILKKTSKKKDEAVNDSDIEYDSGRESEPESDFDL